MVCADVIFEPENDFYERHSDKMVYTDRSFVVNGSATLVSEPSSKRSIATLQNNANVYITFTCLYDGDYWGYVSTHGQPQGWVNINQLLVPYDHIFFAEENGVDFFRHSNDLSKLEEAGSAYMWRWPGTDITPRLLEDIDIQMVNISNTFVDEQEREWIQLGYYFGRSNAWICLSDPMNSEIPAFNPAPEPLPWRTGIVYTEIPNESNSPLVIIIVLVAVLIAGTAALIKILWRKA
jgi:hypothetical protein